MPSSRWVTRAALACLLVLAGCGIGGPSVARSSPDPGCPGALVSVSDAPGLRRALAQAEPGQAIRVAAGDYEGQFAIDRSGNSSRPIRLCGQGATLHTATGYGLHLSGANHWIIAGLAIRGGSKGVVLDGTSHTTLTGLTVSGTSQEAVHLRSGSSHNEVTGLHVSDTGRTDPARGEGVYIGSAKSNWCRYSNCRPDASNHNSITGSVFGPGVTAEAVDAKEGTQSGLISGNRFISAGLTGADSWVDVKGNRWRVAANRGTGSPGSALVDGIQIHEVLDGWGRRNTITGNHLDIDAPGYGVRVQRSSARNVVSCTNWAGSAGSGLTNVECEP